mmetsp:Transcript_45942/g.112091  ORF Transcript_45942/g.112091 Transcript_45942/m.112091 type:complete len:882 (+) Transcript_45942:148-2793(+)
MNPNSFGAGAGIGRPTNGIVDDLASQIILPPPSSLNPIPSLPAALRVDNRSQFLELLLTNPVASNGNNSAAVFRQLLVFGRPSLRTLLMRHVLTDPHERKGGMNTSTAGNSNQKKNKKVNWDAATSFPLPRQLQSNVVGCRLLLQQQGQQQQQRSDERQGNPSHIPRSTVIGTPDDVKRHQNEQATNRTMSSLWSGGGGTPGGGNDSSGNDRNSNNDTDMFYSTQDLFQHVDVVTYFVRAEELMQTQAVVARIKASSSSGGSSEGGAGTSTTKTHHRIVYVPQITSVASQVLQDSGISVRNNRGSTNNNNVSVVSLQLDLFPLESDLISMEYTGAMREVTAVNNTPSHLVGTAARALLKLQDVTGPISRIQTIGKISEQVLARMLNQSVDEYIAEEQYGDDDDGPSDDFANPQQASSSSSSSSLVSDSNGVCLMVMDRRLDLVTPMVTPLTYAGLLDEVVSIDSGFIHIPERVINPPDDDDEDTSDKKIKSGSSGDNPFDDGDGNDSKKKTKSARNEVVALGVHAGDSLFAEVRDQHVEKFGSFLQNQAVALKESHQNFTSKGTQKNLNEIHQFVKQIPIFTQNLRSLTNHIHLAELIKATTEEVSFREQWNTERAMVEGDTCYDLLEEWIYSGYPPYKVLRLLCLQSITSGGIKANRYDALRQAIVQVYGYEFLSVIHDLETCGWIKRKETLFLDAANRSLFHSIRRNLILIHAEVDTVEPDDVSYVSSGYAPLSVRLVQSAMQGWNDKEDVLRDVLLGGGGGSNSGNSGGGATGGGGGNSASGAANSSLGRLLDIHQTFPPQDLTSLLKQQSPPIGAPLGVWAKKRPTKPTLIVMYLGGITFMEIAALRFLSKRDSFPFHIVIVTTTVLNGTKLLQEMG